VDSDNINRDMPENNELQIKTHYEGLDIAGSKKIHYLKFQLNQVLDAGKDESLMSQVKLIEKDNKEGKPFNEKEID
jgi:tRNA (guanine-N7-)-methyltransferase